MGYFASDSKALLSSSRKKYLLSISSPSKRNKGVCAWNVSKDGDTAAQSEHTDIIEGRTHSYTVDKVYGTSSTTQELYENSIYPLVKSSMEGYHSSVLAYGQTSTGKTFTMSGTKEYPGLIPLCIQDCFRYALQESQESREYLIRVSYLEVYKEHIRDLLAKTPEPIRLFDGPDGLIIRGLKEEVVSSPSQVVNILKKGESRRQVGATHMNQHSSRSHVLVRLWIESKAAGDSSASTRVSTLSLVDLAGSESVRLNGIERREEGHYINKSLMTLGQVVLSLSEGKTGHIPYRDSKLTRILQPSLSGNAQMVLLCCISPQLSHLEESHNTFKFAIRAKNIKQKASINFSSKEENTLLQHYREEIQDLKKQLAEAKEQQKRLQQQQHVESSSLPGMDEEVRELVDAIKTMERLILKSRPQSTPHQSTPRKMSGSDLNLLADDTIMHSDTQMAIMAAQQGGMMSTPIKEDDEALNIELGRIRGLLGTVLKNKGISNQDPVFKKTLDFGSPDQEEMALLKHQLEEQEMVTTLRKADSSFLQSQLREKDLLLEEVSQVLEAVELRQAELERENAALHAELFALKAKYRVDATDD
jgi:centromeric protein E